MTVTTSPLPPFSALHDRFHAGDFIDCFRVRSDMPLRAAANTITNFPGWAQALVGLRNVVVLPFGLTGALPADFAGQEKIGMFPIESETEREIIAGFDDKHLDFRVSVMRDGDDILLATWVHRHNLLGRAYLAMIMPFHIAIARDALRRVASTGQMAA
ncbi:DUF2867 domain-containing protein [Shimia haliotis]|uniref:DUF2867 domain-containing protein n=1 Tax=Shimia haliotis TaxID=1280847 RepID=A0A1I4A2P6_9RHOB|nr:DUF2867 domain-containing protein [Shimia haliotis]SFK50615.1 Protein of unknown function [Shimia haliotis]